MAEDNFSNTNQNDNQVNPLISSDPLAGKNNDLDTQEQQSEPISPIQKEEKEADSVAQAPGSSSLESKEQARQRANQLMDEGKFAEAAKILKESGIHETKTPKPAPTQAPSSPSESQAKSPSSASQPPPQEKKTIPIKPAKTEPVAKPSVETPAPAPTQAPSEISKTPTPISSPEPQVQKDSLLDEQIEEKHPDEYLKKAYDLRKELIEYDRSKVSEEKKLQEAEELVLEGNKEKAIELFKKIAHEAEDKNEKEIAIEAYERLAALLR